MSDDTVKREAVIATIGVMYERCDTGDITDYRDMLLESVGALPSAEREGEWIDTGKDPSHSHPLTAIWYRCSECGDGTNTKTKFCPNCGVRMRPRLQGKHFDSIILDECAMKGEDDDISKADIRSVAD